MIRNIYVFVKWFVRFILTLLNISYSERKVFREKICLSQFSYLLNKQFRRTFDVHEETSSCQTI